MTDRKRPARPSGPSLHRVLAYLADLELEVDRLRQRNHLLHAEARGQLDKVRACFAGPDDSAALDEMGAALDDLHEAPGYYPTHDQVVAIALRPLAEQVFRWQVRLQQARGVRLELHMECEYIEWFPARLRHLLDNLLGFALQHRDADKDESWVRLACRSGADGHELRVEDNGVGLTPSEVAGAFELFFRASRARVAGLETGLAIVRFLVEQSGGVVEVESREGQGASFTVRLPPYGLDDYLV